MISSTRPDAREADLRSRVKADTFFTLRTWSENSHNGDAEAMLADTIVSMAQLEVQVRRH